MTPRPARLVAVPPPVQPATTSEPLLTITELAAHLRCSRTKIERDIVRGLPHLDIGRHHPDRRRKRTLRFSWPDVLAFYRGDGR